MSFSGLVTKSYKTRIALSYSLYVISAPRRAERLHARAARPHTPVESSASGECGSWY